jgi:hypothetical protein
MPEKTPRWYPTLEWIMGHWTYVNLALGCCYAILMAYYLHSGSLWSAVWYYLLATMMFSVDLWARDRDYRRKRRNL